MSEQAKKAVWAVWLAAAVAMTAPTMAWHVAYFRNPGHRYYVAALVGLPLLAAAGVLWSRLRRERLWRYEPVLIVAPPVLIALWRAPVGFAVAALLFASTYAAGRLVRERLGPAAGAPAAEIAVCTAAGFGLLHLALFALGMAGLLYWWVVLPLLVLPLLLGPPVVSPLADLLAGWVRRDDLRSPAAGLLAPFAAILALCTAAVAVAPAIAYDAVTMHLPLAQYYVEEHALRPRPGLDYSFFPQSAELVFAVAMQLGGQAAAQLITPGFFILVLLLLWAIVRECGATGAGAFCAVVFAASMPFLHWSGSVVKNDLQLALFQLAALYAILRWRAAGDFRWASMAAIFTGCSFGVKHPALFAGLPLGLLLGWAAWRQPRRIRAVAAILLLAALFGLMWHVRTLALTGSPVYPLRPGDSPTPDGGVDKDLWTRVVRVSKLPFTVSFGGYLHFESPSPTPLGIVLLVFWPVWLVSGRINAAERVCLFFAVLAFFWWGWLAVSVRYIAAPLAVLAGLAGARSARLFDRWPGAVRWMTGFAAIWCVAQGLCSLMAVEINAPQLRYLAGAIGREEYLRAAAIPYPAVAFVTRNTGPDDRTLAIENCLDAYAPPAPRYYSVCGGPWTADTIAQRLKKDRYTWLVAPAGRQTETLDALRACGRHAEERYRDVAFVVYKLD